MDEIKYCLSTADYYRTSLFFILRRPFIIVLGLACFLFIFIQNFSILSSEDPLPLTLVALVLVSMFPILFGLLVMLLFVSIRFISYKRTGYWGHRTITVTPEGITSTSATGTSMTQWNGIRKTYFTRNLILIQLVSDLALVIPVRAFPGRDEAREFASRISQQVDSASHSPSAADPAVPDGEE